MQEDTLANLALPSSPAANEKLQSAVIQNPQEHVLMSFQLNGGDSIVSINAFMLLAFLFVGISIILPKRWTLIKTFWQARHVSKITLKLPAADVEVLPCFREKQIAHQIWTELVTRKAAVPFDEKNDVIVETYNSWYKLFEVIRALIREIPIEKLSGAEKESVEALVQSAIEILNDGLRPHLTKWQAKFRHWYAAQLELESSKGGTIPPQEIQERYPHYDELLDDIKRVNLILDQYANGLKKIARHK